MIILNQRSTERLKGVHPRLVAVTVRAAELSDLEFIVTCGVRSFAEQERLLKAGATRTLKSKHLTGHAVDLAAVIDGEVRWDWPLYSRLNDVMQKAASELGVSVTWGGSWIRFKDGPHFEIDPRQYPFR
jgi:peptidoglycan LD-endopeptidase CwlK